MKLQWIWLLMALTVVIGCQNPSATSTSSGGPSNTNSVSNGTPAPTPTPAKEVTRADIPESVKTLGYQYYGLGNEKSPTFELSGGNSGFKTGYYEVKVVEAGEDRAVLRQSWSGDLQAQLGESEYEATPKGVFALTVGDKKLDPPQMELPADPKPGFKWYANSKLELPGTTIKSSTARIVGFQKTKVKMGTYDTLAVRAQVVGTQGTKPLTLIMTVFYAKNIGPIKILIDTKGPDGKPIITKLEAVKMP